MVVSGEAGRVERYRLELGNLAVLRGEKSAQPDKFNVKLELRYIRMQYFSPILIIFQPADPMCK